MVSAKDDHLQEWAANCIQNVRRLALANERAKRKAAASPTQPTPTATQQPAGSGSGSGAGTGTVAEQPTDR